MKRNWLKTTAATMSLLVLMTGAAYAAEKPEVLSYGEEIYASGPIAAELITLEGVLQYSELEGGYDLEGWRLVADQALLDSLKGQKIWVLGTEYTGPAVHQGKLLQVERIEREVAMNRTLPKTITVNGKELTYDQAPYMHKGTLMLPLRAVIEAAGGTIEWRQDTFSAYVLLSDRTAYFWVGQPKAEMYLHAARYMQQNFLAMDQSVVLQNGRMFISADALTTVLGMTEEITPDESHLALRSPAYQFELPGEAGGTFPAQPPGTADLTFDLTWFEGRLQISGKANRPDLQFQLLLDGKVIGQADTTVKDGEYIANVLFEAGIDQSRLELVIFDPATGVELGRSAAHM